MIRNIVPITYNKSSFNPSFKAFSPIRKKYEYNLPQDTLELSIASKRALANTYNDYSIFKSKISSILYDLTETNPKTKEPPVGTLKFDEGDFVQKTDDIFLKSKKIKDFSNEIKNEKPAIARFILNTGVQEEGDKVIRKLTNAVNKGQLKIKEVKVYRQNDFTSYASRKEIRKLTNACTDKFGSCTKIEKRKGTGYHGIHIVCELDNGTLGELQIMGKHTEALKDAENVLYRLSLGKDVDKKFNKVKQEYEKLDEKQKEELIEYTRSAFLKQRSKELNLNEEKNLTRLKNPNLPSIFDFNTLQTILRQEKN